MGWDYEKSRERVQAHLDRMGEIEVKKLVRDANLEGLLTETCCREIYGSHVYVNVSNFTRLASAAPEDEDTYKRLIQALHLYQREVSRIVEGEGIFDGYRVHFQGPKLHALFYRPIDDGQELASRAVLLQLVLRDFVRSVFNPAFPKYEDFSLAGGADLGNAIGTRNGPYGDRELLFLGSPANHAAKTVSTSGRFRLTEELYDALPEDLQELCTEVEDGLYQVSPPTQQNLDELLAAHSIGWDRDASVQRIEADKRQFPLKDIVYAGADVLIHMDDLSIRNNKRVLAASVYGDVSGFTQYIDEAETDEDRIAAVRVFHAIRKEMGRVVKTDYEGIRVQFQGDRVQGLFHLPKDDEAAIAKTAVDVALALQSSMETSLKECLPEAEPLRLAAGVDMDITLASKLGSRGHRDRICIGEAVEAAARLEERCSGGQTGISSRVRNALPETLQSHFTWDAHVQGYVASDLTLDKAELAQQAEMMRTWNGPVFVRSGAGGVTISAKETPDARKATPSRPYAR